VKVRLIVAVTALSLLSVFVALAGAAVANGDSQGNNIGQLFFSISKN
jgi:hypothetical protein